MRPMFVSDVISYCSRLPDDTEYRSATTTVTHTIDSES